MFPGASTGELVDAAYAIYGAPLDRSTTFVPGTRFGPEWIRRHGRGFEDYDHHTGLSFSEFGVVDAGDLEPWGDPEEYLAFLAGELGDVSGLPVLLGGEHTVSVAGVRACTPDRVVCLDAHLDLRAEFGGDPWSHASSLYRIREEVEVPVTIVGARAGSAEEWERARTDEAVTVVPVEEADDWVAEFSPTGERVYLSLDIDALDPAYAPATGTREPFGLTPVTVRRIVEALAPAVVGADVVEVNDRDDGETATLAAKLVRRLIFAHAATHV